MTRAFHLIVAMLGVTLSQPAQAQSVPASDSLAIQPVEDISRPWLDAALDAASWIRTYEIEDEHGLAWPVDPENDATVVDHLYSGNAGVVLFFAHLAARPPQVERVDGHLKIVNPWREPATRGADRLIANLPDTLEPGQAGLYTGVAGIGFVLNEVYRVTEDERYRDGAMRCVQLIHDAAMPAGDGVEWGPVTDIVSGSAGTGLFLLYAADEMGHAASRKLAASAGERLLELGIPADGGLKWRMSPDFARLMPNFSHGTAGVAFFLARLYEETGREEFLAGALAGARYLLSIAETDNGGCLIMHHEPDGEDLFYLSWCHGPAGTGRLFQQLYAATGDDEWREWTLKCADSLLSAGIPERQTPGFWNNVGQCCGSAGVAQFMIDVFAQTRAEAHYGFALELGRDALSRAAVDETSGHKRWIHAEHRTQPDLLIAQTGYMQGAAGIGIWLLQEHARHASVAFMTNSAFDAKEVTPHKRPSIRINRLPDAPTIKQLDAPESEPRP